MTWMNWLTLLLVSASVYFQFYVEAECSIKDIQCKCERLHTEKNYTDFVLKCSGINGSTIANVTLPNCQVNSLSSINFNHNQLTSISSNSFLLNTTTMGNIVSITLENNCIEEVERNTFSAFTSLNKLKISENPMSWKLLRNIFRALKNNTFRSLNLEKNNIKYLNRSTISYLPHLRSLSIDINGIQYIENGIFAKLPNLEDLSLRSNRLELFEMHNLQKLKMLNLKENKLSAVPRFRADNGSCISQHLITLTLSENVITSLDNFVNDSKCLTSLKTLNLDKNKILTLDPDIFIHLDLKKLDISGFPLGNWSRTSLNKLLKSQQSLSALTMENCSLKDLPEHIFSSFRHLKEVRLGYNEISEWSATTFGSNLDSLFLQGNQIHLINESTYPDVPHIDFTFNPFTCDCRLQWFRNWIKTCPEDSIKGHVDSYKCQSPKNWKNKDLKSFNPTYNDCNPWNPYVIAAIAICITLILIVIFASLIHGNRKSLTNYIKHRRYTRMPASYENTVNND